VTPRGTYGLNAVIKGFGSKSTLAYRFFPIFEKTLFLQPHKNSKEHYVGGILNFALN
jgi:hypothetical protein